MRVPSQSTVTALCERLGRSQGKPGNFSTPSCTHATGPRGNHGCFPVQPLTGVWGAGKGLSLFSLPLRSREISLLLLPARRKTPFPLGLRNNGFIKAQLEAPGLANKDVPEVPDEELGKPLLVLQGPAPCPRRAFPSGMGPWGYPGPGLGDHDAFWEWEAVSSPGQDAVVPGWFVGVLPCAARVGIWDFGRNLNTAVRDAAQGPLLRRGCRLRLRLFQLLLIISLFLAPLRALPGKGPWTLGCWGLALAELCCRFLPTLSFWSRA